MGPARNRPGWLPGDTQTANELIADGFDESVYAEEVGLYSAWIGSYRAASARQTATLAHIRQ